MSRTITVAAAFLLMASASAFGFDASDFKDFSSIVSTTSTWKNQRGSTMTINIDSSGSVHGQYINRAPGFGCQNSEFPLNGRVNGKFIAFAVSWKNSVDNCNSVTGWTGYARVNGSAIQIVTNWNIASQGASGPSIQSGEDLFNAEDLSKIP
ncbi:hypothetical protein GCM10007880_67420 [Mesorhizobium amorphae]|uniref:avidin/streptavidin family protein n=1 Tax=Mesorhizobium amorphae TaxID=71433 RepID=UPI00235C8CA4|nr:avidin/streptavidin family protein [Mesorhizobium amorphae]GLR46224.1 hypothetical protein GCM10007880_67420 [Mesorhizobium amorphae]